MPNYAVATGRLWTAWHPEQGILQFHIINIQVISAALTIFSFPYPKTNARWKSPLGSISENLTVKGAAFFCSCQQANQCMHPNSTLQLWDPWQHCLLPIPVQGLGAVQCKKGQADHVRAEGSREGTARWDSVRSWWYKARHTGLQQIALLYSEGFWKAQFVLGGELQEKSLA